MCDTYPFNLGTYSRHGNLSDVSLNDDAVQWVNRGLVWMYAFNHEEALRCLDIATKYDHNCVFAWLLICYCHGPNYNLSQNNVYYSLSHIQDTGFPSQKLACEALEKAKLLRKQATKFEHDFMDALEIRTHYHNQFAFLTIEAFAKAMLMIYSKYEDDPDVACFAVEAVMQIAPWKHFSKNGTEGPFVKTAKKILSIGLEMSPNHPGLNHFKVHLLEMSSKPWEAMDAANRLRSIVPDCGHLLHMPSHIDVQIGDYAAAVKTNESAMKANRKLLKFNKEIGFEALMYLDYVAHDLHMIVYSALLAGMKDTATKYAEELFILCRDFIHIHPFRAADLDLFCAVRYHVMIRFGQWDEIINEELSSETQNEWFVATQATLHYAKALAYAAIGDVPNGKIHAERFNDFRKLPDCAERILHNNNAKGMFQVNATMLMGEIEYRLGNYEVAFKFLEKAVKYEDDLPYDEPPGQMQPIRHAYGGLLLEQNKFEEARIIFEQDLRIHPKNPWSLQGLLEILRKTNAPREDINKLSKILEETKLVADVPISYSCACVGQKLCCSE